MSEYCNTCEGYLDWIDGDLEDPENCVKCQIKKAKISVLQEIGDIILKGHPRNDVAQKVIKDKITELLAKPTASSLGFEVGTSYRLIHDNRCIYRIVCETHYVAAQLHEIDCLGDRKDYEVEK